MVSDCTLNNNAPFKCNEITKFVNLVRFFSVKRTCVLVGVLDCVDADPSLSGMSLDVCPSVIFTWCHTQQ